MFEANAYNIVYYKSFHEVVLREIGLWNRIIKDVDLDLYFIKFDKIHNRITGKKDQKAMQINPNLEITFNNDAIFVFQKQRGDIT